MRATRLESWKNLDGEYEVLKSYACPRSGHTTATVCIGSMLSYPRSKDSRCCFIKPYTKSSSPIQFFSGIQLHCSRISIVLLSYDSRSALIRLDHIIFFRRASEVGSLCIGSEYWVSDIMWNWIVKFFLLEHRRGSIYVTSWDDTFWV